MRVGDLVEGQHQPGAFQFLHPIGGQGIGFQDQPLMDGVPGDHVVELARLQREENARIDDIRADFVQKKTALQEQNRREADRLAAEVDRLETLNPAGKSAEFMTVLKPKDSEYIDFWCFYDYMRTRVRDMDNIRHRDEEK